MPARYPSHRCATRYSLRGWREINVCEDTSMKFLNCLATALILLVSSGFALGEESASVEPGRSYELQNAIYVTGTVRQVRTSEDLVDLKTPEGLELTVPIKALPTFENRDGGYHKLEPGLSVKARAAEGFLGLEPAENGKFWVTVDSKKFVSLHPNDIDDDVFDDDTQTVRLDDGREVEISLEDYMRQNVPLLDIRN